MTCKVGFMIRILYVFVLTSIFFVCNAQTKSLEEAIRVSAIAENDPPRIILSWPLYTDGNNYLLFKRHLGDTVWGNNIATININDTLYIDNDIIAEEAYEYKLHRIKNSYITAFGYIWAGMEYRETDYRGSLLLLIDEAYQEALTEEIDRLKWDIRGDGWRVFHFYVNRNDSIPLIKERIKEIYDSISDLRTLFLLGRIPVPYSGQFTIPPDGHSVGYGGHTGAWPADVYYADMDGIWTDETVNDKTAAREIAWNVPGDGKFDQTTIPSKVELEMGRVDLFNMHEFSKDDTSLIRFYLDKNHRFRSGEVNVSRRGILDDNFTSLNLASTGWGNMAALVGHHNIDVKDYFTTMKNESYLWSYGCGAGSFTSCAGLKNGTARTRDFANDTVLTVFTMLAGSYFGDWDNANNFLRAPLASSPYALTSFWGGIPKWHVFHMGLGMHIGYGCKLTQNNTDYINQYYTGLFNFSHGKVHIALMGDPSLRMHAVKPPSNLVADSIGNVTVRLEWDASEDQILYYNIYRSTSLYKEFARINKEPVTATNYIDNASENGKNIYMVRAVKLETSASGSYYNMSQGIFDSTSTFWPLSIEKEQNMIAFSVFPNPANDYVNIFISAQKDEEVGLRINNLTGRNIKQENISLKQGGNLHSIELKELPKGVYLIVIESPAQYFVKRFILK